MEASVVLGPSMSPESPGAPAASLLSCVLERSEAPVGVGRRGQGP